MPPSLAIADRQSLERRLDELIAEVRRYPTPIAGCDQHLAALLEERSRIVEHLEQLEQLRALDHAPRGCSPAATWINDGGPDAA